MSGAIRRLSRRFLQVYGKTAANNNEKMAFKRLYQILASSFGSQPEQSAPVAKPADHTGSRNGGDFYGSIEVVTIEGIFQLLYVTNLTGKLVLNDIPNRATFRFTNGQLTWGSLHLKDTQIGQRLIKSSLITEDQLDECLAIQNAEMKQKRIGEILLSKGFLQPDILHESLKDQAREAFFSVLNWRTGTFSFIAEVTREQDDVAVSERIDHLLLEGAVHIDKNTDGLTTISEESTPHFLKAE